MDLQGLVRNRWTWIAVGGGALLAVVGYVVRRKGGGSGGAATPDSEQAPGYGSGGLGYYDSTGADFARQLGQYQAGTQALIEDHLRSIQELIGQLNVSTGSRGQVPGWPGPRPTPVPGGAVIRQTTLPLPSPSLSPVRTR